MTHLPTKPPCLGGTSRTVTSAWTAGQSHGLAITQSRTVSARPSNTLFRPQHHVVSIINIIILLKQVYLNMSRCQVRSKTR